MLMKVQYKKVEHTDAAWSPSSTDSGPMSCLVVSLTPGSVDSLAAVVSGDNQYSRSSVAFSPTLYVTHILTYTMGSNYTPRQKNHLLTTSQTELTIIKQLYHRQPTITWRFNLYQRSLSEEVYSILLPVLATVELWRDKKSVVYVAECVAASSWFIDCWQSLSMYTASLIHSFIIIHHFHSLIKLTCATWFTWEWE